MWNYVTLNPNNSPMGEILSQCSDKTNLSLVVYHLSENHVECATVPNVRDFELGNVARQIKNDARYDHAILAYDLGCKDVFLVDSTPELPAASAVLLCVVTELLNGCVQSRQTQCGRPEVRRDCNRFDPRPSFGQLADSDHLVREQFKREVAMRDAHGRFVPKTDTTTANSVMTKRFRLGHH